VKRSWLCAVTLFPSLSSCLLAPRMFAQDAPAPPQKMRFCSIAPDAKRTTVCETLTWAQDHYDGVVDGSSEAVDRLRIKQWSKGSVTLSVSTDVGGGGEQTMFCSGRMAPAGDRIEGGTISGPMNAGSCTLAWNAAASSPAIAAFVARHPYGEEAPESTVVRVDAGHRVNGIFVPTGATDIFASYPDDVRAILLPEHPLSLKDAMLPCDNEKESQVNGAGSDLKDGTLSLEIGRYALRRGEFERGHCWINHSASVDYQNPRAMVIMGVINLMGWARPKDPQLAFRYFDGEFQTHDAWALYFVEQCYINGTGVAKNIPRAGQIDAYLMTHDDGQAIFKMIGADDEAVQYRAARLKALMTDHSETAEETCKMVPVAGTGTVRQECTTSPVSDDGKAQQNDLDAIDKKYPNQSKPQR
jgi:hypothetical protein